MYVYSYQGENINLEQWLETLWISICQIEGLMAHFTLLHIHQASIIGEMLGMLKYFFLITFIFQGISRDISKVPNKWYIQLSRICYWRLTWSALCCTRQHWAIWKVCCAEAEWGYDWQSWWGRWKGLRLLPLPTCNLGKCECFFEWDTNKVGDIYHIPYNK